MQQGEKCYGIFHYRVKSEKSLFIFFHAVSLLQTLLSGITGWVGIGLCHHRVGDNTLWQHDLRVLLLTAGKWWLAQSWAEVFKYYLVTFNPQSYHNANLSSTPKHKQTFHWLFVCSAPTMHCLQLSWRYEITKSWLIALTSVILQWRA